VRAGSLPDDLAEETSGAEYGIQEDFQVVAGGRVAVEVEATGGFEDAVEFDQARGHHRQVGGHVVAAE